MIKNDRHLWVLGLLLMGSWFLDFWGCNKTDHPFGVNAPFGLDVPTLTPTPSTGAFNCYVYDGIPNGGGSPKQGVTIVLLDPAGNTVAANYTDQFGNALFNPNPLYTGVYNAVVQKQGRYGLSSLPITIASLSPGPVSVLFWDASQALSIVGGVPVSFTTGNGSFPITLLYDQPGTLDVPITVTNLPISSAFNLTPATLVMNKAVSTAPVTINKVACAVLNQPVTLVGSDFLGNGSVTAVTTAYRNFPVNVILSASTTLVACSTGHNGQYQTIYNLSSPSDCSLSWNISGFVGTGLYKVTFNSYLSNAGSKNIGGYSVPTSGSCPNPPSTSSGITLSSPLGTVTGTGLSGTVINQVF